MVRRINYTQVCDHRDLEKPCVDRKDFYRFVKYHLDINGYDFVITYELVEAYANPDFDW